MDLSVASLVAALVSVLLTVVCSQDYSNVCGVQDSYECMQKLRISIKLDKPQIDKEQELDENEKKELRNTCSKAVSNYKNCMGPIIKRADSNRKCPKLVVDMYTALSNGYKDGYNYVCKDGFKQYLEYAKCLSKPETINAIAPCNKQHWATWRNLFVGAVTKEYSKAYIAMETCKNVDMLKSCISRKVKAQCGDKAGRQQTGVFNRITRPQVKDIECNPNKGTHKWATFWILLILGTAAFGAVHVFLVKMQMMAPILPIPGLT